MAVDSLDEDDRLIARGMIRYINEDRVAAGLSPLLLDHRLCMAAKAHAVDMLRRNYMSHFSPEGTDVGQRATAAGVRWRSVGENIAGSPRRQEGFTVFTGYVNVKRAHMDLMGSPGHRANLLGDFDEIGIGTAVNDDDSYIIVQVFAKK